MIQVNTIANLYNGLSISKGMVINFVPDIGNAYSNKDNTKIILPLSLVCYKDKATAENGEYQPVIPIKNGAESINYRGLVLINIEYTNEEWNSGTDVNRDTMETKLIAALEVWNPAWQGNIVKV